MTYFLLALFPPFIVIACTVATRNVVASLAFGIVSAAFIATNFHPFNALIQLVTTLKQVLFDIDKLYLFAFLVLLGTVIEMITHAGGIAAYTQALRRFVRTQKAAQTVSLILSSCFFLDDYFSSLTVGSIMRPLTDSMKIPRAKLAFLINAMSSSLCLVVPASTWVAMILGQLQAAGITDTRSNAIISVDPYEVYVQIIPYLFYPFLSIISAFFIVNRGISFGSMRRHELIAQETGNLFGGKEAPHLAVHHDNHHGSLWSFILPISTFIFSLLFFILYSGNATLIGGTEHFFDALKLANPFWALFMTGISTVTVTTVYFLLSRTLKLRDVLLNTQAGFNLMKTSLIVLFLAYVFSALVINELHTDLYLAHLISDALPLASVPLIIFFLATLTTASIGSAWGTIAILLPLTVRTLIGFSASTTGLLINQIPYFFPTLGALLAGSVAGSHFSPLADGAIIASTSARCNLLDHIKTQLGYLAPALLGSAVAYALVGILGNALGLSSYVLALISGLSTTLGLLMLANKRN